MTADELANDIHMDSNADLAIRAHGDFTFEASKPTDSNIKGVAGKDRNAGAEKKNRKKEAKLRAKQGLPPIESEAKEDAAPFKLTGIDISIPRGSLVVVVGRIGGGKSALLQALIGGFTFNFHPGIQLTLLFIFQVKCVP